MHFAPRDRTSWNVGSTIVRTLNKLARIAPIGAFACAMSLVGSASAASNVTRVTLTTTGTGLDKNLTLQCPNGQIALSVEAALVEQGELAYINMALPFGSAGFAAASGFVNGSGWQLTATVNCIAPPAGLTTVSNSVTESSTGLSTCPAGNVLIGGGWYTTLAAAPGLASLLFDSNSRPINYGLFSRRRTNRGTVAGGMIALCAPSPLPGSQAVFKNIAYTTGAGAFTFAKGFCDAGKTPVAAGFADWNLNFSTMKVLNSIGTQANLTFIAANAGTFNASQSYICIN